MLVYFKLDSFFIDNFLIDYFVIKKKRRYLMLMLQKSEKKNWKYCWMVNCYMIRK